MWIFVIIIGVMLVLSLILLSGKGGFLIAGYNTASKQEKQKYDEKKLCRAVGAFLLLTSLAMIPFPLGAGTGYLVFVIVFFVVAIVVLIYYTNTKCFSPEHEASSEKAAPGKKSTKIVLIITLAIVAASAVFSIVLISYGERAPVYTVSPSDETLTIDSMYGVTIALDTVESVELKDALPEGISRTNGYGGIGSTLKGNCKSDIGKLLVFLDIDVSPFIYLTTSGSEITYIFNSGNPDATKSLYEELSAATNLSKK